MALKATTALAVSLSPFRDTWVTAAEDHAKPLSTIMVAVPDWPPATNSTATTLTKIRIEAPDARFTPLQGLNSNTASHPRCCINICLLPLIIAIACSSIRTIPTRTDHCFPMEKLPNPAYLRRKSIQKRFLQREVTAGSLHRALALRSNGVHWIHGAGFIPSAFVSTLEKFHKLCSQPYTGIYFIEVEEEATNSRVEPL
ncbi:hypothetical protein VNO77_26910 [Canavalia gladiata]|uniref:Uncharacterized protein n=1 Tax=Canavalia gladiata TaxID=3824 RepID=A0AAN9KXX1_CANGL